MAENAATTWTRLTGQPWSASRAYGSGSASANIGLQKRLVGGWRPGGGGGGAPAAPRDNRSEAQRLIEGQNQQRTDLINSQNSTQQGYFDKYRATIGGQEKLGDAYGRLNNEAGIPQLREQLGVFKGQIYNVKGLLDRLNEDINSQTSGTFTTESQARRIEASQGADLNNQLGRLGTGMQPIAEMLTGAQQEVGNRLGFLQADQSRELRPLEMEIGSLSDRFGREITGFNQNKQGELETLLARIAREEQLSDREWQKASALSASERAFQQQREIAAAALAASNGGRSSSGGTSFADLSKMGKLDRIQSMKNSGMTVAQIAEAETRYDGTDMTAQNSGWMNWGSSGAPKAPKAPPSNNYSTPSWLKQFNTKFGY